MQKRTLIKILAFFLLAAAVFASAFFYVFAASSKKIFSSGQQSQAGIVRQFGEMVMSPSQALRGEENGQINILLLGIGGAGHSGGALTDTIMVMSLKPQTHEAALLSIPRDLYVEVEGTNIKNKINAVKQAGDASPAHNGIQLLENTIEDVSGLGIDYYLQLDFAGFTRAVDSVGGIDVYLEKAINDQAYPDSGYGYDPFYIEQGWHHLDGATALKVARSRHSTMGDFDRIKRQQEIIKAFRQKVYEKFSSADLLAFGNMFLSLADNMQTDIEPKELPRFYQLLKDIRSHNFSAQTVDTQKYLRKIEVGLGYSLTTKTGDYSATSYLGANLFDMQIPAKEKPAITAEGALIAIENGTGSPDLANRIAGDLETMGFRIISSANIPEPEFSGVELRYSASTLKTVTLDFLQSKFSARTTVSEANPRADFTIVLGKGF